MTSKEELLGALSNIFNNFLIGIISSKIIPKDSWDKIKNDSLIFSNGKGEEVKIPIDELCLALMVNEKKAIAIEEFEKSMKRSLIREFHEVICFYTESTEQFHKYKKHPLFQFSRLLRNSISHQDGGKLRYWPKDLSKKNVYQIEWRGKKLTSSMINEEIEFTHYDTVAFVKDQIDFVENHLN